MGADEERTMSHDEEEPEKGFLSKRVLDLFFTFQVVVNIIVLGLLTAAMIYVLGQLSEQATRQEQVLKAQLEFVQTQNDVQICTQHDIILAIQKLARGFERVLSLPPIAQIDVPKVSHIDCETLLLGGD